MTAVHISSEKTDFPELLAEFRRQASHIILDKEREIQLCLCCLLAGGHLLIEDIPGVGKTTLVKTMARLLGLESSRVQFTNDLLPADILGASIFDPKTNNFRFLPGPIFSQLVLADELNRATPKTQSACLQAMEEARVSLDGITHILPKPFFLIATQNPRQQIGTYALPESQLDRFLMRIELGFPSRQAEKLLLMGESRQNLLEKTKPIFTPELVLQMQRDALRVHASEAIVAYIQDLVEASRVRFKGVGISPRGALGLLHASQAWAFLHGRAMVIPEDVQAVAVSVMSHRLNPIDETASDSGARLTLEILSNTKVD